MIRSLSFLFLFFSFGYFSSSFWRCFLRIFFIRFTLCYLFRRYIFSSSFSSTFSSFFSSFFSSAFSVFPSTFFFSPSFGFASIIFSETTSFSIFSWDFFSSSFGVASAATGVVASTMITFCSIYWTIAKMVFVYKRDRIAA